jgi:ASC-1-like (ASCH) protein
MKKIISLLIIFCFFSCDIMKQSAKSKGEESISEQTESWRKRKGDTVSYKIPKITLKDTTIYTVNREGTTLRTVYDERGQVSNIDCFASTIEEMNKQNREFFKEWKDKEKTKTEEANFDWVLYLVLGFASIVIIGFLLIFIWLKQQSNIIKTIASKL